MYVCKVFCPEADPFLDMHYQGSTYLSRQKEGAKSFPHVHRCGSGGSMRACHVAGQGSIPGRDRNPGWGFFRVFSWPARQVSRSFRPQGPRISFGHQSSLSSITIHYGRKWPDMLTHPKTSNNTIPFLTEPVSTHRNKSAANTTTKHPHTPKSSQTVTAIIETEHSWEL